MLRLIKRFFDNHLANSSKIEKAFKVNGIQYYNFKDYMDMPVYRWKLMEAWMRNYDARITDETLRAYIDKILGHLEGNPINATRAAYLCYKLKERTHLAVEDEILWRLASICYFDKTERLEDYDGDYNVKKIESWKRSGQLDFFYTKPMSDIFKFKTISKKDLEALLREAEETRRKIDSEALGRT
jgi:hypothetical protein